MRFASLGSGSRGNALIVEEKSSRLMVDCGFGWRETEARLARLSIAPGDISGIVVTHEHSDHIGGVFRCARRWNVPIWMTHGTLVAAGVHNVVDIDCRVIDSHAAFAVGDLEVCPFPVPHDAREPVQFVVRGRGDLGVLTDVGETTPHIVERLSGLDALVLECNHDRAMLKNSTYPASLKARIAGRLGHLANDTAAGLIASIDGSRLQHLVAAHLSQENNRPEYAANALAGALGCHADWIGIATQTDGFSWREII